MDYYKHYKKLIARASQRELTGYTENHHITPRCMGGTDDSDNLVRLTPEEHYVAHQLLVRIYPDNHKLVYAAMMMCANRKGNKVYGWLRKRLSLSQKLNTLGTQNSQFGTKWVHRNGKAIKINGEELTQFLDEGWSLGRSEKAVKIPVLRPEGVYSEKYNWILQEEDQIISEFDSHKSINRILSKRGFKNREGNQILSVWLKSKGREPLKRRNTAGVA